MRLTWAWRQWAFRPGLAVMNVVLLAVGLALLSCLMQARDQWQAQLSRDLVGTDMVIGPKGSPLQLVLAGGQSYPALMPRPAATAVTMLALDASEAAQRLNVSLRQYEVLVLLSRGHSVKGVGRLLGISEATVKTHACTLYRRLNVRNKSEAVYAAMRLGIPLELQGTVMAQGESTAAVQESAAAFVQTAAGPSRASASTSMSATDAVMSAPRVAVADHGAESRWAAMTRAFGGVTPAKSPRPPVRTANGTARLG